MGCTSSAPNMSDPQSHTTENEKRERNDDKQDDDNLKIIGTNEKEDSEEDESTNVECNQIMLPTCDTLEQNLQLDRKMNSPQHVVINEQERDTAYINDTDVNVIMETEKDIPSIELEEVPSKISSFEDVVGQIILESIVDPTRPDIANAPDSQNLEETTEENVTQDIPIEINNASDSEELEEMNEDEEDNLPVTASPSQSEGSRATRWEALADIAAELPPTLAVDPVTGQIFSLTK